MKSLFLTDQGKIRSHNEDAGGVFWTQNEQLLAIVADGMGGHQAGDVASQLATSLIANKWQDVMVMEEPQQIETWLRDTITEVNSLVFSYGADKKEYQGMGTTVVISVCTDHFVTIAHIGDSRCYLNNSHGFSQITEDHSLVNELVRVGEITKNDAENHPRRNVLLKALGTEKEVEADIKTIEWELGDQLLLCSDGLTNKITDEELKSYLKSKQDIEELGQTLIDLANERGGEDNITLAIVQYSCPNEAGDKSC